MEILYTILVAIVCLAIIRFTPYFSSTPLSMRWVQALFGLKLAAGIALGLVYTYHYTDRTTADVFKYFDDGRTIHAVLQDSPSGYLRLVTGIGSDAAWLSPYLDDTQHWFKPYDHSMYNDNRTIIRFNAILMLFSGGYFFVHTAILSFLSFAGTFAIFRFIRSHSTIPLSVCTACVFLLPSFLFWTSGLLKEGLLIFGLGFLVLSADRIVRIGPSFRSLLCLLLSTALLALTKYYVLASIAPGLIILAIATRYPRHKYLVAIAVHLALAVALLANSTWPTGTDIVNSIACKRNDFISFAASLPDVGGLIPMHKIEIGFWPLIAELPTALYHAFAQPLPWSKVSTLSMLPLAENALLVLMLILCATYRRRPVTHIPALLMWFSFTVILYAISGLTTPVVGALVRYKAPAMPFLFAALANLIDWDRTPLQRTMKYFDRKLMQPN